MSINYEAGKALESSKEFKALEEALNNFETGFEDSFIYAELEAGNEVVEDDGNVHVTRGHIRIGESFGQERRILKSQISATARVVDSFIAKHPVLVNAFNAVVEEVKAKINSTEVKNAQKFVDDCTANLTEAREALRDAEDTLKKLLKF